MQFHLVQLFTVIILSYQESRIIKTSDDEFCTVHSRNIYLSIQENHIQCLDQSSHTVYTSDALDTSLVFGKEHFCYIDEMGAVQCSGDNTQGQLNKPIDKFNSNTDVVTAGHQHTCALSNQWFKFNMHCWGASDKGQLEVPNEFGGEIEFLKAGPYTTCAKMLNSSILCWGANPNNIQNPIGISKQPFDFSGKGTTIVEQGSDDTMCAIKVFDNLTTFMNCWGKCTGSMCKIPGEMKDQRDNETVSVGQDHVCTIRNPKKMAIIHPKYHSIAGCWGANDQGQSNVPQEFKQNVSSLSATKQVTCAINQNQYYNCFGKDINIPNKMKYFGSAISTGGRHTCATLGGSLECFGNNEYHQSDVPLNFKTYSLKTLAGWDYSCSISVNRAIACWGLNLLGQTDLPPVLSRTDIRIKDLAVGLSHSCVIWSHVGNFESKVTCWGGNNEFNQLDQDIEQIGNVEMVTVGDEHSCIWNQHLGYSDLTKISRVICIGENSMGQSDVPVDLSFFLGDQDLRTSTQKMVYSLSAGDGHTCSEWGNRHAFMLVCWGANTHGQSDVPWEFRFNPYNYRDRSLTAGTSHTCLIHTNTIVQASNLVCWGVRTQGRGDDRVKMKVQQPHLVSAGQEHDCVIGIDGRVECLGDNEFGECEVPWQSMELEKQQRRETEVTEGY